MILRGLAKHSCQVTAKDLVLRRRAGRVILTDWKRGKWLSAWTDELGAFFSRVEPADLVQEPHLLDDCDCVALDVDVLPVGEKTRALFDDGGACSSSC